MERGTKEIGNGHARDFAWVLEGEKQTFARAIIGLECEKIFAVHRDLAFGHVIIGMAGHDFGERAFPRAVRAHNGVHFATGHSQTQAADDLLIAYRDMEVFDTELVHKQGARNIRRFALIANGI